MVSTWWSSSVRTARDISVWIHRRGTSAHTCCSLQHLPAVPSAALCLASSNCFPALPLRCSVDDKAARARHVESVVRSNEKKTLKSRFDLPAVVAIVCASRRGMHLPCGSAIFDRVGAAAACLFADFLAHPTVDTNNRNAIASISSGTAT